MMALSSPQTYIWFFQAHLHWSEPATNRCAGLLISLFTEIGHWWICLQEFKNLTRLMQQNSSKTLPIIAVAYTKHCESAKQQHSTSIEDFHPSRGYTRHLLWSRFLTLATNRLHCTGAGSFTWPHLLLTKAFKEQCQQPIQANNGKKKQQNSLKRAKNLSQQTHSQKSSSYPMELYIYLWKHFNGIL